MKKKVAITDEKRSSLLQQLQLRLETARTKFRLPPVRLVVNQTDNLGHIAGFYVKNLDNGLSVRDPKTPDGYIDIDDFGKKSKDMLRTTTAIIIKAEEVGDMIGEYTIDI